MIIIIIIIVYGEISKVNPVYEEEPEMEIHPTHIHGKHAKSVVIGATEGSDQKPLILDASAAMTGTSAIYKFSDDMPGQGSLFDDKDSKVASTAGAAPISVNNLLQARAYRLLWGTSRAQMFNSKCTASVQYNFLKLPTPQSHSLDLASGLLRS